MEPATNPRGRFPGVQAKRCIYAAERDAGRDLSCAPFDRLDDFTLDSSRAIEQKKAIQMKGKL